MAVNNPRPIYSFSDRPRFSNFCFSRFSRNASESHQASPVPRGSSFGSGGDFFSHHKAGYRSSFRQSGSFFVPNFCYTQTFRRPSSDSQSKGYKCVYYKCDSCVDSSDYLSTRLGRLPGSPGRVPPRSYSSSVTQTSRFSVSEPYLPISGSSLRSAGFPLGFYPLGCHAGRSPSLPGNSDSSLPRRLAYSSLISGSPPVTSTGGTSVLPVSRLPDQLGEVLSSSFSGTELFGRGSVFPRQIARPSDRRIESLILLISRLVVSPSAPAPLWQQFLGHLANLKDLVVDCLFMSRPLQIYFLRHFCPLQDSPDLLIPLTPQIKAFCLAWASREFLLAGKRFVPPPPLFTLTTDASNFGWGASLPPLHLSGQWSPQDRCLHINQQELKAVSLALQGFLPLLRGHPTLVRSDSLTVVAYINHQGGTHSVPLCLETLRLLTWCRQEGIVLSASHIPGQQNLVADFLSRGKFLPSEWSLHPSVFLQIRQVHPPLAVDLFASSLAHLLPCYCARADDPDAWALDAFSIPWSDFLGYAFPPFALLPRVLEKVASDRASLLLIAPFWPKRPWFPRLLSLLAGQPRSLPVFPGLLRQPISLTQHPNPGVLHLTLWPLSAQPGVRQAFLSGLPNSQPRISDPRREQLMIPDSGHSSSDVPLVRLTHIMPL